MSGVLSYSTDCQLGGERTARKYCMYSSCLDLRSRGVDGVSLTTQFGLIDGQQLLHATIIEHLSKTRRGCANVAITRYAEGTRVLCPPKFYNHSRKNSRTSPSRDRSPLSRRGAWNPFAQLSPSIQFLGTGGVRPSAHPLHKRQSDKQTQSIPPCRTRNPITYTRNDPSKKPYRRRESCNFC